MNMKKLAVAGAMLLAGTFGAMGMADAATGIVNVNAVLSGNAAFQKAGKTVAAEQQKLQKEYNEKSKGMNDADKKALEQKLNQQLAQKENEVMKPIQDNFKAAVEKAAKAKKIDTVVVPGGIIYGTISADLTEDVKSEYEIRRKKSRIWRLARFHDDDETKDFFPPSSGRRWTRSAGGWPAICKLKSKNGDW